MSVLLFSHATPHNVNGKGFLSHISTLKNVPSDHSRLQSPWSFWPAAGSSEWSWALETSSHKKISHSINAECDIIQVCASWLPIQNVFEYQRNFAQTLSTMSVHREQPCWKWMIHIQSRRETQKSYLSQRKKSFEQEMGFTHWNYHNIQLAPLGSSGKNIIEIETGFSIVGIRMGLLLFIKVSTPIRSFTFLAISTNLQTKIIDINLC